MDIAPISTRSSVPEFLRDLANQLRAREDELGRASTDGAEPADIDALASHFEELLAEGQQNGGCTQTDTWVLYQHMAIVSKAWLFPEGDPLAERIVGYLEEARSGLGTLMDEHLPESAEQRKQWEDLTALQHATRRAEAMQLNRGKEPSLLRRLFRGARRLLERGFGS